MPRSREATPLRTSGIVVDRRTPVMNDRDREKRTDTSVSAEAVETLVWLLDTNGVDRRRYAVVNRLRAMRDSDEFATLPADLRERVREIIAEQER
jgi:hypothetical protein